MTIHAAPTSPPTVLDFAVGIGRASHLQSTTRTAQYLDEHALVEGLRDYIALIAEQCLHDSPTEYEDFVADLTEADSLDAPSSRNARFTYLLHAYADYMPSPDCEYLDSGIAGCHTWISPDGGVLIDIVTTLALGELSPDDDQALVMRALHTAHRAFGNSIIGARMIVLDAPYESSFFNPRGGGMPLLASDLNPLGVSTASAVL